MDLLYTRNDLVEKAACLTLSHTSIRDNMVEELPTAAVLHDEVELSGCLNDLEELDDMRMLQELKDVDLTSHTLHISNIYYPLLLENLHGDFFTCEDMSAQFHLAEGPLANGFAQNVMADRLGPHPLWRSHGS